MNYTPTPIPQVLGAATGVGAATVLPETGSPLINSLAIAVAVGLVVWAVMYFILRKKAQ